jgi:hypothetical protein
VNSLSEIRCLSSMAGSSSNSRISALLLFSPWYRSGLLWVACYRSSMLAETVIELMEGGFRAFCCSGPRSGQWKFAEPAFTSFCLSQLLHGIIHYGKCQTFF